MILSDAQPLRQTTLRISQIANMKLHLNTTQGQNAITGHGDGYVTVNHQQIDHALIVLPDKLVNPWNIGDFASLAVVDFAALIELRPELVVFGAGKVFRFPDVAIMAAFSKAGIGFEVMDTPAACRTYNVLISEGRYAAAALLT